MKQKQLTNCNYQTGVTCDKELSCKYCEEYAKWKAEKEKNDRLLNAFFHKKLIIFLCPYQFGICIHWDKEEKCIDIDLPFIEITYRSYGKGFKIKSEYSND